MTNTIYRIRFSSWQRWASSIRFDSGLLLDLTLFFYLTSFFWINRIPINSWLLGSCFYIPMILYMVLNKRFVSPTSISIYGIAAILFLLTYLLRPNLEVFFTRETYGIDRVFRPDRAVYLMLIVSLYDSPKRLMKALCFASLGVVLLSIPEYLQAIRVGYWLEYNYAGVLVKFSYSLAFGYRILLPCLVFLGAGIAYTKFRLMNFVLFLGSFIMVLSGGSRGQLLCLLVFVCLMLVRSFLIQRTAVKLLFIFATLIAVLFVLVVGIETIVQEIGVWLESVGVSSRTVSSLINGSISDDNSRFRIWGVVIEAIQNGGFWGYGVYGDRPFIYPIHYAGFSHNIFLELMVSFGMIPGGILSIVLAAYPLILIFRNPEHKWIIPFIIMLSISSQLLISMSFWYVSSFWASIELASKFRNTPSANGIRKKA